MGVVYHANYLVWMEVGRVEFCRSQGLRYRDLEDGEQLRLAVVESGCRYLTPARYDDEVIVKTWVEKAHPRMVQFGYEMRSVEPEAGLVFATGHTKHIFVGMDMKPRKLPEAYRPIFGMG